MPRGKWSPYEHGSRAICLAHWEGHIPPRRTSALAMYCDIVPTLIDLAGGRASGLDGTSLRTIWSNPANDIHRKSVFISNVHPFWQKAIVTDRYKLIWSGHPESDHIWSNFHAPSKFFSRPWSEWVQRAETDSAASAKLRHILRPQEFELYDVVKDPYETTNLASQAAHQARVADLRLQLQGLMSDSHEPLMPPTEPPRLKARRNAK